MGSLKIAIIAVSHGGQFAGIDLKEKGHQVDIYERSAVTMDDRGAGLVVQPENHFFLNII
ncbi:hypothetical protein [Peribacillus huizhouensis]|uniref:2-polyprenyl-6-methoxyphenol hydroxylase-like FAD-dependent oxidoreductase n=1 Tax=Peribacillus huizhouensis TaxID=1501239 RepID=A0ABR6CV21_9BACI|nr:hypothetical protein [Peribacillus huizhouensis]MBA9028513.1 2-polyprenyl-6-methoxyphenol hydroxylase-like FAD-dependent oxidoreductase [Peribacillus huizhouensis]